MSTKVKTFHSKVTDEYGGEYPEAFVAVRSFSESSQNTGHSDDAENAYIMESDIEAISYKVSYWYSERTKASGKRSRPLMYDNGGTFTDVFKVDLEHIEAKEIIASPIDTVAKTLTLIQNDVIRRFK